MFYHGMNGLSKINFNTYQAYARRGAVTSPNVHANKLSIYYFNDLHGNTDKMAGVMEAAKSFNQAKKDVAHFTLSAGDNVSGGDVSKNNLVLDLMQNAMGVDISCIGNHEIDASSQGLMQSSAGNKIDFVTTNATFDDDSPMHKIVKRSIVKEQNGVKYGFVGAMPVDFETCTKKSVQKDIDVHNFNDTINSIQKEVNELKKQGINRIILLSHSGYENDKKMASLLDGVDIIIGGHSHTVVEGAKNGENVVKSKSGEPVIITQAGENGKYYGILDVEFDAKGVISKISNQLNAISSKKSPTIEYVKMQKMGESPKVGTIKEVDDMPKNRRLKPHGWANMVVDSMKIMLDSDVAFLNAANVRKVPTEGTLTQRDVSESVPMKNRLIKTRVTQKQMVDAIKQAAKESLNASQGEPGLLFASGITYKIDDKGNLLELYTLDKKGNKTKVDINNPSENITYSAVYDDFTMRGDGEYPSLAPKFPVQYFDYDKDVTAIEYIKTMKNIDKLEFIDDKRLEILPSSRMTQSSNNSQRFLNLTAPKAS